MIEILIQRLDAGPVEKKPIHPSEEVAVHRTPLELVLGTKDRQAVTDRLLDLRLEVWVLCQKFVVRLGTELGMIFHVLNLLFRGIAGAHEAGCPGCQLGELIDMVAHVFALVEHIHELLDLSKLRSHSFLVEVGLHDGGQLLELSLPEGNVIHEVKIVGPVGAVDRSTEFVELLDDVVPGILERCDVGPSSCQESGGGPLPNCRAWQKPDS
mmetsp:Transcript_986/g.1998  ORF Transcript_986/g.1998 Transcript_986/m.1998 type:complete len:211 (+) Transcript_986:106-738(+)